MPVEVGLEFVAVVRAYAVEAEGEALDHLVDERDHCGLGVFLVYLQSPDPGRIVDGGVLEAPDLVSGLIDQLQELHVLQGAG